MANPSAQRIDVWHLLDDATQQLAAVHNAGLDTRREVDRASRLMNRLDSYERFWLFPGPDLLGELRALLEAMDLDLARRQVDIEGFRMVRAAYKMALAFRQRLRTDRTISRWFDVPSAADLVPAEFRDSQTTDRQETGRIDRWNESWRSDEFVSTRPA